MLRSARSRTAASVTLMIALVVLTTAVGVMRTRDHQARLQSLKDFLARMSITVA